MSKEVKNEDIWKDVCNKVVRDALFEKNCITDTLKYLSSKYKIETMQNRDSEYESTSNETIANPVFIGALSFSEVKSKILASNAKSEYKQACIIMLRNIYLENEAIAAQRKSISAA